MNDLTTNTVKTGGLLTNEGRLMDITMLPPELQEQVKQYAALGVLGEKEAAKLKAQEVDVERQAELWLGEKDSPKTKAAYSLHLDSWLNFCLRAGINPILATVDTAREWVSSLRIDKGLAPASVNLAISAGSSFYSFLAIGGHIVLNPFRGVKRQKTRYKHADGSGLLTRDEVERILVRVGCFTEGFRAASILGLRVSEIKTLKITRGRWSVTGKGNKTRGGALAGLPSLGVTQEEILYLKGLNQQNMRIFNPDSAGCAVRRAAKATGIKATTHSFRHYRAGLVYRHTKDILAVKRLLGHATIAVTDRYLQQTVGRQE